MQKKICLWIIGYILLLSLAGLGFYLKNSLQKLPLMEEAIIRDLIAEPIAAEKGMLPVPEAADPPEFVANQQPEVNYWSGYQERKSAQIAPTDKMKMLLLVQRNLSSQEMGRIYSLAQGGMTADEQVEIRELLRSRLNAADRQELKTLLMKYF